MNKAPDYTFILLVFLLAFLGVSLGLDHHLKKLTAAVENLRPCAARTPEEKDRNE